MQASIAKMRISTFRPALWPSVATLLLVPLLVALGFWQLQRADEKSALFASLDSARNAEPVDVTELTGTPLPYHAHASGHYASKVLLLDNRVHDGEVGYEVLLPLRLGNGRAVLVNQGWIAQGRSRERVPQPDVPTGRVSVSALALSPPSPTLSLTRQEAMTSGWPKVTQVIKPKWIEQELGYSLLPMVLYPDGSEVAQREWKALHHFGPPRHRAYALQWFVMAALALLFFLRHALRRGGDG